MAYINIELTLINADAVVVFPLVADIYKFLYGNCILFNSRRRSVRSCKGCLLVVSRDHTFGVVAQVA
jgi:hypothetical protein